MSRWADVDAVAHANFMTMQKSRHNRAQAVQDTGSLFFFFEGRPRSMRSSSTTTCLASRRVEESSAASSSMIKFS